MAFKVGDRVLSNGNIYGRETAGILGTVIWVGYKYDYHHVVEFDSPVNGHTGAIYFPEEIFEGGKDGHCLYVNDSDIKLAPTPKTPYITIDPYPPIFDEFKTFEEELKKLVTGEDIAPLVPIKPPKLTSIQSLQCRIASANYPYAVKDSDDVLWFYSDLVPNCFETKAIVLA